MSSFKPKMTKKIKTNKKNFITLDNKHNEFLNDFNTDVTNNIPILIEEKRKLKSEIANLSNEVSGSSANIEKKMDIIDKINEIKQKIKEIKNKKKDYFLNNSQYIFDYFENKKNISSGSVKTNLCSNITTKNKLINSFFKIDETQNLQDDSFEKNSNNILQKYLTNIDDNLLDINTFIHDTDICKYCYKGELIPLEDEGILICNNCSRNVQYLIENDKPSYKEPPKEVCFYAYKRINHFKEILSQFQGKETTQIHPDVIENIKMQIKKERIDISQITNNKTKEILKKLGYNKYYEHIPFIKDKMGIKPPVMSTELEETLCNLFIELQAPYSKYCPNDRVNFLNYYYTAYKLCELLGATQYLEHFPMLKDREKRMEQDAIWKKICKELDWEFIPTI